MSNGQSAKVETIRKKSSYHHGDLRNSIIEAVAYLIAERKSLDFQLKDVTQLVGTSTPSLYRHFKNKQDLLLGCAIAGYQLQQQYRATAIQQADPSPLAKLLAVGFAYVHFSQQHPGFFLLMKSLETDDMLSSSQYQGERLKTIKVMRSLIQECIDEGYFQETDIDLAMASLQATALGIAHLYLSDQLRYVAKSIAKDKTLPAELFTIHFGNLLSSKGRRHMKKASADPFL